MIVFAHTSAFHHHQQNHVFEVVSLRSYIMLIMAGSFYFAYVSIGLLSSCSCRSKILILVHSVYLINAAM
jgi:hypothetical protein